MTYIITPYHKAFKLYDTEERYEVRHNDEFAHVEAFTYSREWISISPKYIVNDYMDMSDDTMTRDEAMETAIYDACEWLEDFLIRLASKPTLIHCVTDGEMFMR